MERKRCPVVLLHTTVSAKSVPSFESYISPVAVQLLRLPDICIIWLCHLSSFQSSQRLPLIEEQLGKLITDEPSVIESSLAKFGDIVHPDRMSVLQRYYLSCEPVPN